MTVISDDYWYIVRAAAAGVLGDFIAFGLRNVDRPDVPEFSRLPFRRFGTPPTCSPWRSTKGGLGWSIHMTLGAPFLAGVAGLLISLLVLPGRVALRPDPTGRITRTRLRLTRAR
ncbi:MAG: hypothetical protein OEY62_09400 [Acidimicrobiia bacterium]|nr:hypothetical protein [Acidimicrobiia bacterium]